MNDPSRFNRRHFLAAASAMSASSLLALPRAAAAEPPPEISKIRLVKVLATCFAPQYIAEDLLYAEGFTDIEYVNLERGTAPVAMAEGRVDISMWDALATLPPIDAGQPVAVLAGLHAGCWELFATGHIRTIRDLKDKTVAIKGFESGDHLLLSSMLAYVGMDPRKDVKWIAGPKSTEAMDLFVQGKADAYMGFAPQPQELRRRKIGHAVVDTTQDRPWSQYFCCVVAANREFITRYPVAAKRALRAILKGADVCAEEPERVARVLASKGYEQPHDRAVEVLRRLPYRRWRDSNPEDTLRFHALHLLEAGLIKSDPNKLIAQGTDWRFLNELKKELKA